jgi:hypothetical protein
VPLIRQRLLLLRLLTLQALRRRPSGAPLRHVAPRAHGEVRAAPTRDFAPCSRDDVGTDGPPASRPSGSSISLIIILISNLRVRDNYCSAFRIVRPCGQGPSSTPQRDVARVGEPPARHSPVLRRLEIAAVAAASWTRRPTPKRHSDQEGLPLPLAPFDGARPCRRVPPREPLETPNCTTAARLPVKCHYTGDCPPGRYVVR